MRLNANIQDGCGEKLAVSVGTQGRWPHVHAKNAQDGYVEERSVTGPVNLTVPGGAAGEAGLPLRLLDGFCLYVVQEDDSELAIGLEQLHDGARTHCLSRHLNRPGLAG